MDVVSAFVKRRDFIYLPELESLGPTAVDKLESSPNQFGGLYRHPSVHELCQCVH